MVKDFLFNRAREALMPLVEKRYDKMLESVSAELRRPLDLPESDALSEAQHSATVEGIQNTLAIEGNHLSKVDCYGIIRG